MKIITTKECQYGYASDNKAPSTAGIVFVWLIKKNNENKWVYVEILKISTTTNIHEYIDLNANSWNNEIHENTNIYFSWTIVSPNNRPRACAAFINRYRPKYNNDFLDFFPFGATQIICENKIGFFEKQFIIGE